MLTGSERRPRVAEFVDIWSCTLPTLLTCSPRTITFPFLSTSLLLLMLATRTLSDENRAALDGDHPLDTIAIPTGAVDAVELTNFTTVGSYSYLEGDDPILLIPCTYSLSQICHACSF